MIPQIAMPEIGQHNKDLDVSIARLKQSGTYKDLSTIIICPTRGMIPAKVVQSWMGLMRPMNQKVIGPMFGIGMEVGESYNNMIQSILDNPELSTWKYILTIEEDNCPPADGLLKLYESMDKYDVVQGLYWTKGEGGQPMCFDDQTEILTISGWKYFKDLSEDEVVATLTKDGYLEYNKIIDRQVFEYSGDMIHWKGQMYDLKVTPEHNVYCSKRNRDFELCAASDVENYYHLSFKKDAKWIGEEVEWFNLTDSVKLKMDDWLEFLGYYISEGCCPNQKNKVKHIVDIRQHKGNIYEDIYNVCERLGFNPRKNIGRIQMSNRLLKSMLQPLGKAGDKYVPEYIHKLSSRQIKIFLDALWKGDGCFKRTGNYKGEYYSYVSKSKRLADDVQSLLLKIGISGTLGTQRNGTIYRISTVLRNLTPEASKGSSRVYYKGLVYDVTVPNNTLYIRRNGKTMWSGNCYGDPKVMPKNFIPQMPIPGEVQPANGLGMGFNLFKLDMFKDPNIPKPWFRTVQEVIPGQGARAYTQDLYFYENAAKAGYKFACDNRVLVGHYDVNADKMW